MKLGYKYVCTRKSHISYNCPLMLHKQGYNCRIIKHISRLLQLLVKL